MIPRNASLKSEPLRSFGPSRRLLLIGWLAGGGLIWLALASDPAGAILAGLAAVALLGEVGLATLSPNALVLHTEGLTLTIGLRRVQLSWADVGAVRAVRLGRLATSASLEIETEERAYVIAGFRLSVGADQAALAIEELRPD